VAVVIFITYFSYTSVTAEKAYHRYTFNGIVDKVTYDEKSIPSVTIKGKTYYLGSSYWNFNHLISEGDSIKKDSGDTIVKLVKHENWKIIIFDDK
jgi:hypothetical protein